MSQPMLALDPTRTLVFVGGGNMGRSLIGGLIARGTPAEQIVVADPSEAIREALHHEFQVRTVASANEALSHAALVMLAVKPQVMRTVCENLANELPQDAVVISIAAGLTVDQLDRWLGGNRAVVRAMPNTPALLGVGATGVFANARVTSEQRTLADTVLSSVGVSVWIEQEAQMDVVTALSGSGPAYFFLLTEAMQAAAEKLGLPENAARILATQTCLGAGRMLTESDEDASTLRQRVTSPGGTTQAALESFSNDAFIDIVNRALKAAATRGAELSASAGK